jgi:mono/diheme cytochrome c family protein
MKQGLMTVGLCIVVVIFLWAQPKKPVATQKKTTTVQTKKTVATPTGNSAGAQTSMSRGQAVYMRACVTCHQKDGGGVTRLNPPLIKTSYVLGDKKRLINIVLKGMNQPIEIDDEEYSNPMPPQPHLTDQEVADVLTFVRNNFGNKASAVTPAEVKAARAK